MAPRRILAWPGSYNVRDLGGLPTADGRTTRLGAVLRSESPAYLEPEGWDQLVGSGVRTTIDLRSSWETEAGPYASPDPAVERRWLPLEEGLLDDPDFAAWGADGTLGTALYFAPYLERWPDRPAAVLRAIATAAPGGVLFHCERGRDRTGLIAILLLSLAGVPDEVIVADHLLTDEHLTASGVALGHISLDGEADLYAAFGTGAEATLFSLLAQIDVADLLRSAGASDGEIDRLRDRMVR